MRDLYISELRELRAAEDLAAAALVDLGRVASAAPLREMLEQYAALARRHVGVLDALLAGVKVVDATDKRGIGVSAILEAYSSYVRGHKKSPVLDAALIVCAQKTAHVKIAGYGSVRTFAGTLGDVETHRRLQECLNEEADVDHRLTQLAEHSVNIQAITTHNRSA